MKVKVFYSWQSDIDFNNQAIRDALKLAIIELEKNSDNPRIDPIDSTSNLIGSKRIPDSILNDISNCDIFLCDLTIVGRSDMGTRKIPNPNVLIELGYAIAELGWHRTIVVFNEQFGELNKDLPFDIEKRSTLLCKIQNKDDSNGKGVLKSRLKEWIQRIINENPTRPQRITSSDSGLKRKNDVKYLTLVIKHFDINEMDNFFKNGYGEIHKYFVSRWNEFDEFIGTKEFFMYDLDAKRLLLNFYNKELFKRLLNNYTKGRTRYVHRGSTTGIKFDNAESCIKQLEKAYTELLDYIRNNYLEIKVRKKSPF